MDDPLNSSAPLNYGGAFFMPMLKAVIQQRLRRLSITNYCNSEQSDYTEIMFKMEEAASFNNETTTALLSLLAMTALSDKRLYSVEIDSFVKTAKVLAAKGCFTEPLSEAKLLMWFELNKAQILYIIKTPDLGKWHEFSLKALEHVKHKFHILQAMIEISKSDDEFHFSEKALILLTARRWNIALEDF